MNKRRIERMIPLAVEVLRNENLDLPDEKLKIMENDVIKPAWRGQLASFGATVATGGLLAAAAFFDKQGNAELDRAELSKAIYRVMKKHRSEQGQNTLPKANLNLLDFVLDTFVKRPSDKQGLKEEVLDAATALKLAMNLFIPKPENADAAESQVVAKDGEKTV